MLNNFRALRCAMLVSAAVIAEPAFAQSAASAAASAATSAATSAAAADAAADATAEASKGGGPEEIVVTANKREENLQKAPVSISAITAAQAEFRGITEVKDIS